MSSAPYNSKELMGAGNNFLHCTDACGGRERPCKAQLGTGRPRIGGVDKMQNTFGAGATARSAGALRTPFLAAKHGRPRGVADRAASRG